MVVTMVQWCSVDCPVSGVTVLATPPLLRLASLGTPGQPGPGRGLLLAAADAETRNCCFLCVRF